MTVTIRDEYIELFKLLQMANLADSGGHAKMLISEGEVTRNGEPERRKSAKIRPGETICLGDVVIEVAAGEPGA
jgi:ribosome-associated protein